MALWLRDSGAWVLAGSVVTPDVDPEGLGTTAVGTSNDSARADHGHSGTFLSLTDTEAAYGTAGQIPAINTGADGLSFIDASSVGASIPYNDDTSIPAPIALAGADGADNDVARFDHVHAGRIQDLNDGTGVALGLGTGDNQYLRTNSGNSRARWQTLTIPDDAVIAGQPIGTATAGSASTHSRGDHAHNLPLEIVDDLLDTILAAADTTTISGHVGITVHRNDGNHEYYLVDRIEVQDDAPTTANADDRPNGNIWIQL